MADTGIALARSFAGGGTASRLAAHL
jgi:hypothetical protein